LVFAKLEIFHKAITDFSFAIQLDPQLDKIYLYRGLALNYLDEKYQATMDIN
jgi:hypothetical protein